MMIRLNKNGGMAVSSYLHGEKGLWGRIRDVVDSFAPVEDMIDSVGKYMLGELGVEEDAVSVKISQLIERLEIKQ